VRRGEGLTVLTLAANVFVLLFAYYLLKVTREALITPLDGGPRLKAAAAAGMAVLLVPFLRAFDALSERVGRLRLITATTLFFFACLVALGVAANLVHGGAPLAVGFFVFVGIFNLFVIAQFWAFANDVYSEASGKRLFGIVAVGSAVGGILGAQAAKKLFDASAEGRLMFVAAALLLGALALTWAASALEARRARPVGAAVQPAPEPPLAPGGGWALLARSRYFVLMAAMLIVYNCVNSVGEFVLSSGVKAAALASGQVPEAFVAAFMGDFFGGVNLVTLLLQLFVVSRVLEYAGVRVALFVMPLVALGGYLSIGALLSVAVIRVAKTAENGLDYSLQNTTRQALWLVTSREEKYKVKALVDTFFVRLGDVAAFGLITLGLDVFHLSTRGFALTNVALVLVWLAIAFGIAREYRKRSHDVLESTEGARP
jgi:AAA family ATP:ADP antiporter